MGYTHCRVQPPDAENRMSGGVRGSRRAITVTRPDRSRLKPTNDSWRVDETYIRVKGNWRYLYRAVDSSGATLDFLLSAKQDAAAAKRFLTKALGRANHPAPRVINTDKHAAYPPAIVQLKDQGVLEGSGANIIKYMFLSGEKASVLGGQDHGPNFRSGGCFSG